MTLLGIKKQVNPNIPFDNSLLWIILSLMVFGLIMVTSASMSFSESDPFFYTRRELIQITISLLLMIITLYIPMQRWQQFGSALLIVAIIMLIAVLGIGSSINGASRWIPLGVFNFQPAELAKLSLFIFLAGYLSRKSDEVQNRFWGFFKPMVVMTVLSILLLKQPDLGTVIVLFMVTIGILFIAGAQLWQFIAILLTGVGAVICLILFEAYRLTRLLTFLDPWQDATGSGYQLVASLMAIGSGGITGQGMGNSILKLGYLPECHTDFIFSIISEEFGYVGVITLLILLFFLTFKALAIGYRALNDGSLFSGYLACEIGIWFGFQTFVNIGVTSGMLPTKGLTLPFISYGGSSLIVMSIAVAILLRIDFEFRQKQSQARIRIIK
ncbi:cell division protein FtsW [Gilliamella sp. B2776]|uniref:cell division protein FtsW n=1 Tax=unclassified Gilliamella TaxID=2685620 RepID=UPI00226A7FB6|nr:MULTISPECIES: cell division protein FtsW [unclassified Gilliamella]MCX8648897.1 cell division protein FtsW [Gilliamella sp. B2779]MCX8653227.1 cell division protein FtsW [Gilliamella sp. B2737]MCX8655487.1 cell division protein FtsW [Gilliamella sp. B2894]MCX8664252.1 cell division protein FtsW [Gilliamella sp. B2887]MCX8690709.1 cell division protein FtsW [Gilliamella sp. B2776]